jgi:hypothetical protein
MRNLRMLKAKSSRLNAQSAEEAMDLKVKEIIRKRKMTRD